jgi:REP element-mobilizing transposase RayT
MVFINNNKHRRSIRLSGYDYSAAGFYFITICTQNQECLFGQIKKGRMVLSPLGEIVRKQWSEIPRRFSRIRLDEFVVMPNHIHGVIEIVNDDVDIVGAGLVPARKIAIISNRATTRVNRATTRVNRATTRVAPTIGDMVGAFKSLCVKEWLVYIKKSNLNWHDKIWQRNYYEHIIGNEKDYNNVVEYIRNNPVNWQTDRNLN